MDVLTEARWKKAMDWWKTNPHSTLIRKVACDKMIQRGCEEIGSSDVNHEVYSMWQEWERSKDQYPTALLYLVDYANN
jgi:hypothetical protein